MLVLAHANGFRIDLHELRERVLEPARDADGSAHRQVEVRKLLYRRFTRRIDGCAGLVHHKLYGLPLQLLEHLANELVRFPAGGPVADGDQLDGVLFDKCLYDLGGLTTLPSDLCG